MFIGKLKTLDFTFQTLLLNAENQLGLLWKGIFKLQKFNKLNIERTEKKEERRRHTLGSHEQYRDSEQPSSSKDFSSDLDSCDNYFQDLLPIVSPEASPIESPDDSPFESPDISPTKSFRSESSKMQSPHSPSLSPEILRRSTSSVKSGSGEFPIKSVTFSPNVTSYLSSTDDTQLRKTVKKTGK